MFGRKRAFLSAMVVAMMLLSGCGGSSTTNNLGGAMDGRDTTNGATSGSGTTDSSGRNGGTNNGNNGGTNGGTNNGGMMQDGGNDGVIYWDGYGINTGRPLTGSNGERNTYGMRVDGNGITVGQDLRNAWDDLTCSNNRNTNKTNTKSAVN